MQPKPRISPEEYLARERQAQTKSEYFDGEIFAMSGASEAHVLIVANVVTTLHDQLRGRDCRVYARDLRVKVSATRLYTYPDVVVVCGEARFEDERADTLMNPQVIVEVLSKTTQDYDRGAKLSSIAPSSRSWSTCSSRKTSRTSSTSCASPTADGCLPRRTGSTTGSSCSPSLPTSPWPTCTRK